MKVKLRTPFVSVATANWRVEAREETVVSEGKECKKASRVWKNEGKGGFVEEERDCLYAHHPSSGRELACSSSSVKALAGIRMNHAANVQLKGFVFWLLILVRLFYVQMSMQDRRNIIAVGYGATDCAYPRALKFPTKWTFESHIVMKSGEQASRSLVVNNEIEVELGEDGQPKKPVEKTFWQKYWMYIVPLVFIVLNVVTQAANMPDESTGQSGAPQRAVSSGPRRR
ncbi:hypothetical protein L7F22_041792 [Adiantum nelumboides]|nr:hypothetical protein [Adiantum nelumboides]